MKLLLATDGSPYGEAAVQEVCARPWPPGTGVTVLTAACIPFPAGQGDSYDFHRISAELAPEVARRAGDRIRELAPALRVEHKTSNDLPKGAILDEAERLGADLILVGSHGYGPVRRFVLGSVSHAVALHAACSVEVVRRRPPQQGGRGPFKLLLAIDGSPCGGAAVEEVCERPWPPGAEVRVVTAVRPLGAFDLPDVYLAEALPEAVLERQRDEAAALLEKAAARVRERQPGLPVTAEPLFGLPQYEIVDEAERWGADLVVIGSHGYGAMKRVLLGSVSQAVALYAGCSVEVVRRRPSPAAG